MDEGERVLQREKLFFKGIERESFKIVRGVVREDKKEEF